MTKASDRVAEWRKDKLAEGYKQKAFLLPPKAIKDLDRIAKRDELTEVQAIAMALSLAARGK